MLQIPRIDGDSPISNILKNFNAFNKIPPKLPRFSHEWKEGGETGKNILPVSKRFHSFPPFSEAQHSFHVFVIAFLPTI